ncbi:MAG: hypothetical protein NDI81_14510 [Desulfobacula sp.]|nr:hypothetical protein [Desulfobacula sp.]
MFAKKMIKTLMASIFCLTAVSAAEAYTTSPTLYFNGYLDYDADDQVFSVNATITGLEGITGLTPGQGIQFSGSDDSLDISGVQNSSRIMLSGNLSDLSWLLGPDLSSSADILGLALLTNGAFFTESLMLEDFSARINGRMIADSSSLPVPVPSAWLLLGSGLVLTAGRRRQSGKSKTLGIFLVMGLMLLLPLKASASMSYSYLDVQNLFADAGLMLSGTLLNIDATAIALGNPYSAIDPTDFFLTATKNAGDAYYSGTLSAGNLLSASFTDLSITEYTLDSLTYYEISAGLTYTGGLLTQDLSSGMFFGFTDSLNQGYLISQIYDVTPIPENPVPLPSALVLVFSGLVGLIALKKRLGRPNRILISG